MKVIFWIFCVVSIANGLWMLIAPYSMMTIFRRKRGKGASECLPFPDTQNSEA